MTDFYGVQTSCYCGSLLSAIQSDCSNYNSDAMRPPHQTELRNNPATAVLQYVMNVLDVLRSTLLYWKINQSINQSAQFKGLRSK